MKSFKEYLQERITDDEAADLERRKERNKRSAERKKENLAARKVRYRNHHKGLLCLKLHIYKN